MKFYNNDRSKITDILENKGVILKNQGKYEEAR